MFRWLLLAALSGLACVTTSLGTETKDLVTVEPPDDFSVSPGHSEDAEIRITVADGFHVQANPAANEFLIPLTLELESENDLEIGEIRYPEGETYRLKGSEEDLLTYDGTFSVYVSIQAPISADEGISTARGRLRYQACDHRVCLPPATISFDLKARVRRGPGGTRQDSNRMH